MTITELQAKDLIRAHKIARKDLQITLERVKKSREAIQKFCADRKLHETEPTLYVELISTL